MWWVSSVGCASAFSAATRKQPDQVAFSSYSLLCPSFFCSDSSSDSNVSLNGFASVESWRVAQLPTNAGNLKQMSWCEGLLWRLRLEARISLLRKLLVQLVVQRLVWGHRKDHQRLPAIQACCMFAAQFEFVLGLALAIYCWTCTTLGYTSSAIMIAMLKRMRRTLPPQIQYLRVVPAT